MCLVSLLLQPHTTPPSLPPPPFFHHTTAPRFAMEAAVDMAMTAISHEAKKLRQGGAGQGLDVLENDINVRTGGRGGRGGRGLRKEGARKRARNIATA